MSIHVPNTQINPHPLWVQDARNFWPKSAIIDKDSSGLHHPFDLDKTPPDDMLLEGLDPLALIATLTIPWRKIGDAVIYASADPDNFTPPETLPFGAKYSHIIFAPRDQVHRAIRQAFSDTLLTIAHNRCPDEFSCKSLRINPQKPLFLLSVATLAVSVFMFAEQWLIVVLLWITLINSAMTILRISAVMSLWNHRPSPAFLPANTARFAPPDKQPIVTLLVPLFKEDKILPRLINNLKALDYPPDLLEIILLLEESDPTTAEALSHLDLPSYIVPLIIPKDTLQTKPKAMNFALPFCRGEIIGVYDAEDRPAPDQIRKVICHFLAAPANVACVQGQLDFYNSRSNWIARCFTIEYAMWFRVVMKGVQNLGLPIPLGGTTLFFRHDILKEIGGWDAYNVTEDADLGMRLARFGYRCEIVETTTMEEANNRPVQWVRQRSRWLKGFAMTWATHMRQPRRLWRELGPAGFAGFQVLLLSGLTSYLAMPLFLALWATFFAFPILPIANIPQPLWLLFIATMISAEVILWAVALIATWGKARRNLIPYILALPFYWILGAFAAYKAIAEVIFAPFYWDKTSHGHSDEDR